MRKIVLLLALASSGCATSAATPRAAASGEAQSASPRQVILFVKPGASAPYRRLDFVLHNPSEE